MFLHWPIFLVAIALDSSSKGDHIRNLPMLWMYEEKQNSMKQITITFGHILMVSKLCLIHFL